MMRKSQYMIVVFAALSVLLSAQPVEFEKLEHDFGRIREEDGSRETVFTFTNLGDGPVRIRDVKASCGCTSSGWSAGTINPGETGEVRLVYDPEDRPGSFSQKATVMFEDGIAPIDLRMTGEVIPDPEKYRKTIGHLLIKEHTIDVQVPFNATVALEAVPIKNCCGDTIEVTLRDSLHWANVWFEPSTLTAGAKGWMMIEMDVSDVSYAKRDMIWVEVHSGLRCLAGGVVLHVTQVEPQQTEVIDVSPEEANTLLDNRVNILVLDVRTPEEYAQGHLRGAVNIDYFSSDFAERVRDVGFHEACLVYCKGGVRSAKALPILQQHGFKTIYHLASGYDGWRAKKLDTVK